MSDEPIAFTKDGRPLYDNAPTVVAVAIEYVGQVLAIRRNTDPGKGLLALPGGFQMRGETWQEAGIREVQEELGINLNDHNYNLFLLSLNTDHYGHNVAIGYFYLLNRPTIMFNSEEVQEVVWIDYKNLKDTDWAFPLHYTEVENIIYERWK